MNNRLSRQLHRLLLISLAMLVAAAPARAESVTFGTDWKAEAEHGGYYQALATGIYQKYGLDVTLRQGGPQVNHAQLLAAGVLDFNVASNSFGPLNFAQQNIPMVAVAALFQKDPSVLIAHPGEGNDSFAALKGKPIMISGDTRTGSWLFLKQKFGYTDDQIRPYNFSVAPFLADKKAIQQGYLSSEPYTIEKEGVKPVVLLIADAGYASYGSVIQCSAKLAQEKPDLVQRFVNASIEGWYSYLYGDPSAGNALIKKDNPEMNDDLIAYGVGKLKEYGVVDSGDAKKEGIGAMTDARWKEFFDTMAKAGLYPGEMDYKKAYVLQFVDKKVGMKP
ncbi:MAG: ABC transporter substrate-binding protein [Alphaproteobacteria bacterium]|nr:ABC transporter substrate-binding protein [Alphaproteobacteria bacterium]